MDVCQAVRVNLSIHLIPGNILRIYTHEILGTLFETYHFNKFLLLSFIFCHKKKKKNLIRYGLRLTVSLCTLMIFVDTHL